MCESPKLHPNAAPNEREAQRAMRLSGPNPPTTSTTATKTLSDEAARDTGALIVAMMEHKIGQLLDDRKRLCAERDRYRTALERIYANAVDSHPSARDYAGDVLHGSSMSVTTP